MSLSPDNAIIAAVIVTRLVLPLFIPKFPLPAILACLLVDGIDQTIFQTFTNLNLDRYQSYDKALDVYYLVLAYLSTLRNWRSLPAFRIGRFLLYYRLVGVTLFELTEWRPLLLVFPNTFEYFFIFYEALRTRYNPLRYSQRYWLFVAAGIWIFIKLPQESWIHIARLDTTDLVKQRLLGVSQDASFALAITNRPWVTIAIFVLIVLVGAAVWFLLVPRLPPPHHAASGGWQFAAERLPRRADTAEARRQIFVRTRRPIDAALLEKVVLVLLVTLIFAQILPNFRGTNVQLAIAVIAVVTLNSFVSHWFAHRGMGWRSAVVQFATLLAVNVAIVFAAYLVMGGGPLQNAGPSAFLLALLTLLITLYDYFRPVYSARFESRGRGGGKVATR